MFEILLKGVARRSVSGWSFNKKSFNTVILFIVVVVVVVVVVAVVGVRCDLVIVEGVVHADPGGGGGDQRQAGVHSHRGQTGLRPGQRGAVLGVRG